MTIPTDEALCEMTTQELQLNLHAAIQLRHQANKRNQFQKAQAYGDLIFKCKQLLEDAN